MSTDIDHDDLDIDLTDPTKVPGDRPAVAPPEAAAEQPADLGITAPVPVVVPDAADAGDDLWPAAPPKGVRLRIPSLLLSGLVVAGLGFAGGASAYKRQHPVAAVPTTAGANASAAAGAAGGAGGAGQGQRGQARAGTGGGTGAAPGGAAGPGGGAGATFGTVKSVDGSTIYLTDQTGNLVKVTLPDGTTVTATRPGTAADVRPGDTVVVQGAKQPDGSTQAATVSVNPQTGGGFQRGLAPPTTAAGG